LPTCPLAHLPSCLLTTYDVPLVRVEAQQLVYQVAGVRAKEVGEAIAEGEHLSK
jgi:hypothetical protein